MLVVDDMPVDHESAALSAGLVVTVNEDFTPLMPLRGPRMLASLVGVNRLAATVLRPTPAHVLLDSLHGALMLERLYRRGRCKTG